MDLAITFIVGFVMGMTLTFCLFFFILRTGKPIVHRFWSPEVDRVPSSSGESTGDEPGHKSSAETPGVKYHSPFESLT